MEYYEPAEDSHFLGEIVSNYLKKLSIIEKSKFHVLDLGTGSGIQSEISVENGINKDNILAVDINPHAIQVAKNLGLKTLNSNLFEQIKNKFDLIIFNPPYLPEHQFDDKPDTTGGKKGDETIVRFIKQLKPHLAKKGVCFLLTSSYTPEKRWKIEAKKQKLKIQKVATKPVFYEELFVWEVRA
ncbi:MAG: HemK2/MTQ2 family protein methyltransferase [Candidatus Pacearchaeota archaeon]|jgi:release factor glutamine methyltransferase